MKTLLKSVSILLVFVIFSLFYASPLFASGAMYITPASQTVTPNETFTAAIRISSNEAVNAVQVNLSYPSESVDVVSISASGSAFPIGIQSKVANGTLNISRGVLGSGITGDNLAITINFKVKSTAAGTIALALIDGSALVRSSDQQNILIGPSSVVYTISTTKPTLALTPGPTAVPIQITNVSVTDISYTAAAIRWNTNQATSSLVEYGLDSAYGLSAQDTHMTTTHKVTLPDNTLTPGVTYHYRVKSTIGTQQVLSPDKTFSTPGIPVAVELKDSEGNSLANTPVTLITPQRSFTSVTSEDGTASFMNVPATKATVQATPDGLPAYTTAITIVAPKKGMSDKPQQFTVHIAGMQKNSTNNNLLFLVGLILLIVVPAGGYFFWRWKKRQLPTPSPEGQI